MSGITGLCYAHFEQGMEHVGLSIQANYTEPFWAYEDLYPLKPGDILIIRNQMGLVEWAGTIDWEYQYVGTSKYSMVSGIQKGVDPDRWASYFQYSTSSPYYFIGELLQNA